MLFILTFDQYDASLLNKSANFFQKHNSYWPQTFKQWYINARGNVFSQGMRLIWELKS